MKTTNILLQYKRYGFIGFIRLIIDLITTKIFFPKARIVRNPNFIRGAQNISFGKNLTTGVGLRIDALSLQEKNEPLILLGDNIEINDYVHIGAIDKVSIGDNTLIGSKVLITDHNHGNYSGLEQDSPCSEPNSRRLVSKAVFIGKNVWIGENVSILSGSIIGNGCVIGANSVIKGEFPDYCVIVGSPAHIVKKYNPNIKKWEKYHDN